MNYIYVENGKINGCGLCPILNKEFQNIEVSEEFYRKFQNDTDSLIYKDGKIVENPDFEILKQKEEIQNEINAVNEKLAILDLKRIRAVCEDEIRNEKTGETWLDFYNSQIYDLRTQLNSLEAKL